MRALEGAPEAKAAKRDLQTIIKDWGSKRDLIQTINMGVFLNLLELVAVARVLTGDTKKAPT